MSSTNKTANYELSQYIGSDKPTYLVDYNGDMLKIDTGMAANKAQADATDLVVAGHTTSIEGLQGTVSDQGTSITGLRTDVDGNTGSINTINSLIGNGEPTTTDKTLIGAINELHADDQTITGLINNGNWRVKSNSILEVTGDGVKTFSQLFDEMYTSLAALQASLPANQAIHINAIFQDWETRGAVNGFEWLVGGGTPDSHIDFQGFTLDFVSTNVTFFFRVVRANGSEYRGVSVASDNTVTYNDYSANILNADAVLQLSYTIYEQA